MTETVRMNVRKQICDKTYAFLKKQGWTTTIREIAGLSGENMRLVKQGTAPAPFLERIRLALHSYVKERGRQQDSEAVTAFCNEILEILGTASSEETQELISEYSKRRSKTA